MKFLVLQFIFFTSLLASQITHGPMVGHTSDTTTSIWIRAKSECDFQVKLLSPNKHYYALSNKIKLTSRTNFCGTVTINNLSPSTSYSYQLLLDNKEQTTNLKNHITTYPSSEYSGILKIGFGHSVRGEGQQITWKAVEEKSPDIFILMGDNIYSNNTQPQIQRQMYLNYRNDPYFSVFSSHTPIYAVWDDHDYGQDNSDRNQSGKELSLKTFFEIWPNPPIQASSSGIWTRFTFGPAEFYLLDVRYHRSPNSGADGPEKTMLGEEQKNWLVESLKNSTALFKFPVSGSSWNCGGVESWNHRFTFEYDWLLNKISSNRINGIILLGGDQHQCKICVRPAESWQGYDLREWMAGQIWNKQKRDITPTNIGFGIITIDTRNKPESVQVQFYDIEGKTRTGKRILYTIPGALRSLWHSPEGVSGDLPPRSIDGELRPHTSGKIWESLPNTFGETISIDNLKFPQ